MTRRHRIEIRTASGARRPLWNGAKMSTENNGESARAATEKLRCPKCELPRAEGMRACPRCGLDFDKHRRGRTRWLDARPRATSPARAVVEARWEQLRNELDDEDAHRAFIQLCAQQDMLDLAGQFYREAERTTDHPGVAGYRERVLKAAMARLGQVTRGSLDAETTLRRRTLITLTFGAVLVLLLAVGYLLASRAMTKHVEGTYRGPTAPEIWV